MDYLGSQSTPDSVATKANIDLKVDKIVGKGLSTEDYTSAEKTKLAGVATGATANSPDADLVNRANHTGVQPINTVSGLQTALDSKPVIADSSISNVTVYSSAKLETVFADFSDQLDTIISDFTAAIIDLDNRKVEKVTGKGLSTEDYTTAEKSKLAGIAAGATVNSTDAALRDRATHTGTQAISTVTGLQTALDGKVDEVAGKGLSTEDYTTAEKTKLAGIQYLHSRSASAYSMNTTTLTNVTDMAVTLDANSVYEVDLRVVFSTDNTANGITIGFADMTGGAIPQLEAHIYTSNVAAGGPGAGVFAPIVETTNVNITRAASTAGVNLLAYVSGRIYTGGSSMTLTPQVAAASTSGTTSVAIGGISCLATKVA